MSQTHQAHGTAPAPGAVAVDPRYQDERTIRELLHNARTIAIVGLSPNVLRPSNFVGYYLQRHGYRVIPVNPREREILGERSYASLDEIPVPVDVVDVFRRSEAAGQFADEAVAIGAKGVWLQLGVIDEAAAERARSSGLLVVMDRCPLIEYPKLLRDGRIPQHGRKAADGFFGN